jgi:uncharacterized protein (DUF2461 family)
MRIHPSSHYIFVSILLNNISVLGSGLWHPEADKLALLREDIDGNSQGLKSVLKEERLRREFFEGIPDDEDEAVKAFVSQNSESALKTKPKVRTLLLLRTPGSFCTMRVVSIHHSLVDWNG